MEDVAEVAVDVVLEAAVAAVHEVREEVVMEIEVEDLIVLIVVMVETEEINGMALIAV